MAAKKASLTKRVGVLDDLLKGVVCDMESLGEHLEGLDEKLDRLVEVNDLEEWGTSTATPDEMTSEEIADAAVVQPVHVACQSDNSWILMAVLLVGIFWIVSLAICLGFSRGCSETTGPVPAEAVDVGVD